MNKIIGSNSIDYTNILIILYSFKYIYEIVVYMLSQIKKVLRCTYNIYKRIGER